MIDSRNITDLHPCLQRGARELSRRMRERGYDMGISSTYRDGEYQNALYAKGRTAPGQIVTNAKAGQSIHNYRMAFDIFKNVKGHAYDDAAFFDAAGKIWREMGGEWGGSWTNFPDRPHMQYTGGLTLAQLQAGRKLPEDARMKWEGKPNAATAPEKPAATVSPAPDEPSDRELLARLVHFEARGEDERGKMLVVRVVLNRVKARNFPDTVREVIYQPGQFSPVSSSEFETIVPAPGIYAAVGKALTLADNYSQGATFFCTPKALAAEGKFMNNAVADGRLKVLFSHGGHVFLKEA